MGLLDKLKSLLGSGGGSRQSSSGGEAGVTVEREPSTESEAAVKGTADAETSTASSGATADAEGGDGADEQTTDEAADEPVDSIKGIGATYAGRLNEAGIETVADLAEADAERVADVAQASETKAQGWIDRAQEY